MLKQPYTINDIISMSVILVYIIPIIMYYNTGNIRDIIAIIGAFITVTISEGIKYAIIGTANPRPKGAYDCNLLCTDGLQEGRPGMPSGHSALVGFFVGYYWNETSNKWIKLALILFAVTVMYSRYMKRCHTIQQIIIGNLFGAGMSIIVKRICV